MKYNGNKLKIYNVKISKLEKFQRVVGLSENDVVEYVRSNPKSMGTEGITGFSIHANEDIQKVNIIHRNQTAETFDLISKEKINLNKVTPDAKNEIQKVLEENNYGYKQYNDNLFFNDETSNQIKEVLDRLNKTKTRVRIDTGDTNTGISWGEEYDIAGTIGKSGGKIKVPLLINNSQSSGGGEILTHCIVQIRETPSGKLIYQHENYKPVVDWENAEIFEENIHEKSPIALKGTMNKNNEEMIYARFSNEKSANKYLNDKLKFDLGKTKKNSSSKTKTISQ